MKIIEIDPSDKRQARLFLDLPFKIYRDIPQWVPPLETDARRMLNRRSHPFYAHSAAAFFLAATGEGAEGVVGRLAVLDNRHFNEYNHEQTAFFYLFECQNNPEAGAGLFAAGEAWIRGRGLNRIYGPKGFTALDGMGLLVKGFERRPALGIPYNPAYYAELIVAAGFAPVGDTLSGYMHRSIQFPEKIDQVSQAVQEKRGLRIARYSKRGDLRSLVHRAGRFLDRHNRRQFAEAGDRFGLHVFGGSTGDVVQHNRQVALFRHGFVVLVEPFLRRLVVIGSDHQRPIRPHFLGEFGETHCFASAVGACAGDDFHPSGRLFADDGDHPFVFVVRQCRTFPGRSHRAHAIGPHFDMPVDHPPESRFVNRLIAKRRNQGHRQPRKLFTLSCHERFDFSSRFLRVWPKPVAARASRRDRVPGL